MAFPTPSARSPPAHDSPSARPAGPARNLKHITTTSQPSKRPSTAPAAPVAPPLSFASLQLPAAPPPTSSTWTLDLGLPRRPPSLLLLPPPPARSRHTSEISRPSPSASGEPSAFGIGNRPSRLRRVRSAAESSAGESSTGSLSSTDVSLSASTRWKRHQATRPPGHGHGHGAGIPLIVRRKASEASSLWPSSLASGSASAGSERGGGAGTRGGTPTPTSTSTSTLERKEGDEDDLGSPGVWEGRHFTYVAQKGVKSPPRTPESSSSTRTFGEESWEFQVAAALLGGGIGAPSTSGSPPPPSATLHPPRPERGRHRSTPPARPAASLHPPPSHTRHVRLVKSAVALRPHPEEEEPSLPPALLNPEQTTYRPPSAASHHSALSDASSNDIFYDVEDDDDAEKKLDPSPLEESAPSFAVKPAMRASIGWSTLPSRAGSPHHSSFPFPALPTLFATSPPLSPSYIIDLSSHPYSRAQAQSQSRWSRRSSVSLTRSDLSDEGSGVTVVIPFPPAPLRRSGLASASASHANFLPLRLAAAAAVGSLDHPPMPSSSKHVPLMGRRLGTVPVGAWLFVGGFVCPLLWWIGAFVPRSSSTTGQSEQANQKQKEKEKQQQQRSKFKQAIPLTDVPGPAMWSHRLNIPRGRSRTESALSRLIDGDSGGAPPSPFVVDEDTDRARARAQREAQNARLSWRRRNRIMSLGFSVVLGAAVVAFAVWGGLNK
ncbi:hypothetical protein JCM1840_001468 [Sporobolomyces johnsonii]